MKDKVRLVVDVEPALAALANEEAARKRVKRAAVLRWALIDYFAAQLAAERAAPPQAQEQPA